MAPEIKVDLHKLFTGKPIQVLSGGLSYFALFIPGLFIEVLILFTNPSLIRSTIGNLGQAATFGNAFLITFALISAFFIGASLVLYLTLFVEVLWRLYRIWAWIWRASCEFASQRLFSTSFARSKNAKIIGILHRVQRKLVEQWMPPFDIRGTVRSLRESTKRLLQLRYGIETELIDFEDAWLEVLAFPPRYARPKRWINLFHATGWGIFFAARFAIRSFSRH